MKGKLNLNSMENKPDKDVEITPLVKSLSGVIELPKCFDAKKEYADYLDEKYK